MSPKIRRSAGSFTPLESWLARAGVKRRDPARDLEAFGNGQPFKMFCMTWTVGQARKRRVGAAEVVVPRGGWLHLTPGAEAVWHSSPARETVIVPPQATLARSDRQLYFRNQAAFTLGTLSGLHDFAIRKVDEELLRLALVTGAPAADGPS
ncbi:hypothetical protein [Actinoplanes sp. NBRC 101535]|uniref:hypothetical protein n=1 Tax=Actinoplanes sp. NBRC 101535 TaxID=3032196 RepID=UPI0024A3EC98|nr:hypothetical protein [Actinoplanes sp. NBRC 101535]GLY08688.1 hypothetical protein Acsp01_90670 [Actinoplanes sp. NBRC 101535]